MDSAAFGEASPELRARIGSLAERFLLPPRARRQLVSLLQLVIADPRAPTTVRDPAGVLNDHLADSLVALGLDVIRTARTVADLGSGAGFPGLPLAVALPSAQVNLVESVARKCDFIASAITACGISNASVVAMRAESWTDGLGCCDVVTARALAPLPVVAEYAAPLLRVGGALVAWRGRRDPPDEAAAADAALLLGLDPQDPLPVSPYAGAHHRHLHVFSKVAETPDRFPRRPGMARKRPLGSSKSDRARR